MKWRAFIGLALVVSTTSNINADPSASISWLMDEPASLFDIGMLRMRFDNRERWTPKLMEELHGKKLKLGNLGVGSVVYNWDENTITITAPLIGEPTEAQCKSALNKYKKIISPSSKESKLRYMFMAGNFGHINYKSKSRPEDLDKNISKLFVFTIGISDKPGLGGKSIYCSSRLDSDVLSITKYGF